MSFFTLLFCSGLGHQHTEPLPPIDMLSLGTCDKTGSAISINLCVEPQGLWAWVRETKMAAPLKFISRRSPVVSLHGSVASSQPLATEVGVRILKAGGNAADAAVAVAACLNVTEPCSTGIGGDAFCLFYDAEKKIVRGINGR